MTEKEKKAITQILWYKDLFDKGYCDDCNELCSSGAAIPSKDLSNSIEILLNLIKSQQKEIENKNKLEKEVADDIDEVAKELAKLSDNIFIVNQAMKLQKIAEKKLGKFYID